MATRRGREKIGGLAAGGAAFALARDADGSRGVAGGRGGTLNAARLSLGVGRAPALSAAA
jgi:hypothetical protein